MPDISRQQLKGNELAEYVVIAVEWIKNNRPMFLSIAGTVIGALIITVFFFARYHTAQIRAADKLAMAEGQLYSGQQPDQASKLLDELIDQYPGSDIGTQAALVKTDYYFGKQNYADSQKLLQQVIEKGKPKYLMPFATADLGVAYENSGKYADAVKTYNSFLASFPDHFLAPKIHESLARVYELTGATAEAKSIYEKMVAAYSASFWAARAQERIAALTGTVKK